MNTLESVLAEDSDYLSLRGRGAPHRPAVVDLIILLAATSPHPREPRSMDRSRKMPTMTRGAIAAVDGAAADDRLMPSPV